MAFVPRQYCSYCCATFVWYGVDCNGQVLCKHVQHGVFLLSALLLGLNVNEYKEGGRYVFQFLSKRVTRLLCSLWPMQIVLQWYSISLALNFR